MKMNNEIRIKYMTQDAINTLKNDINKNDAKKVNQCIEENKENSNWLEEFCECEIYEERKNRIPYFSLKLIEKGNDNEVQYQNAIILYESLKKLPRYVLTNERFWAWLNFDIGYKYALQAMPVKSKSTVGNMYLFNQGQRRGIFFGVLSRLYFWVDLTVDETNTEDKYHLTKFAMSNISRIRNITWRSNSSEKHIVRGMLKALKDVYDEYNNDETKKEKFRKAEVGKNKNNGNKTENLYTELTRKLSLYCSVRIIDAMTEEDIYLVSKELTYQIIEYFNN